MMLPTGSSRPLFTLLGFPVAIPLNTLIGVVLIAYLWRDAFADDGTSGILSATIFAVLFLASVLVHELAHAVVARFSGLTVHSVTLWALGGVTRYSPAARSPGQEAAIAAVGPAATLLLAGVAWWLQGSLTGTSGSAGEILAALAYVNLLVGLFNLLPGLPLDGGSVVAAAVWRLTGSRWTGVKAAAWAGRVIGGLLVILPLVLPLLWARPPDLIAVAIGVLVGLIIYGGATASLRSAEAQAELERSTIGDIAHPVVTVSSDWTVDRLPNWAAQTAEGEGRPGQTERPILLSLDPTGRQPAGVVVPAAVAAVPRERRSQVTVSTVCRRLPAATLLPAHDPAGRALTVMRAGAQVVIAVAADGQTPVGIISLSGRPDAEAEE